jgi:PIN domain
MHVTPLPGADRNALLKTLRSLHTEVVGLRGGGAPGPAHDRIGSYLEWAANAVRHLDNQVKAADIGRLVLTHGYDRLLNALGVPGTDITTQRVLNDLVSLELDQRVQAFEAAVNAVQAQIGRWPLTQAFVVPDTSFYIEHKDKLEEADFQALLGLPGMPVQVLVPIVVVDELDGLKKSKDKDTRWRAAYTLAVLDRVLAAAGVGATAGTVIPADQGGGCTVEIVFDPPGHVRLPINDDELIDRILAIQPLAGRQVTLLTYDTGQSTRARAVGLPVKKLTKTDDMPTDTATGNSPARAK